jgi:hypothetical protein
VKRIREASFEDISQAIGQAKAKILAEALGISSNNSPQQSDTQDDSTNA